MRVCSADYTLHNFCVTAAQLYSLSSLTSVGLSVGLHRNYNFCINEGIFQPLAWVCRLRVWGWLGRELGDGMRWESGGICTIILTGWYSK